MCDSGAGSGRTNKGEILPLELVYRKGHTGDPQGLWTRSAHHGREQFDNITEHHQTVNTTVRSEYQSL